MPQFLIYNLKAGVCLVVFYLFYKLLLSRDTFHRFNRVILLCVTSLSFLLPLCVITIHREAPAVEQLAGESVRLTPELAAALGDAAFRETAEAAPAERWPAFVKLLFIIGAAGTILLTVFSILRVVCIICRGEHERLDRKAVLVRRREEAAPFSWLKYIVISFRDYEENGPEIIAHERAHIRLHHSFDLLLVDIFGCLQWFNPAMWLLRQELRAIHEYEADRAVIQSGVDEKAYQMLLIKKAAGARSYSIANSLNHSKLKNRITMMLQKKSPSGAKAKALFALPLVCLGLMAFATTEYTPPENKDTQKNVKAAIAVTQDYNGIVRTTVSDRADPGAVSQVLVYETGEGDSTKMIITGTRDPRTGSMVSYSMDILDLSDFPEENIDGEKVSVLSFDMDSLRNIDGSVQYFIKIADDEIVQRLGELRADTVTVSRFTDIGGKLTLSKNTLAQTLEILDRELNGRMSNFSINISDLGMALEDMRFDSQDFGISADSLRMLGEKYLGEGRKPSRVDFRIERRGDDYTITADTLAGDMANIGYGVATETDGNTTTVVIKGVRANSSGYIPDGTNPRVAVRGARRISSANTVGEPSSPVVTVAGTGSTSATPAPSVEVLISRKGKVMIDGDIVGRDEVGRRMVEIAAEAGISPARYRVSMTADRAVKYGYVEDVRSQLESAGVRRIKYNDVGDLKFK